MMALPRFRSASIGVQLEPFQLLTCLEQPLDLKFRRKLQGSSLMETWNREKLYAEVWDQPLVKVAPKYGISAMMLGKV
jgi:hypothetical protein